MRPVHYLSSIGSTSFTSAQVHGQHLQKFDSVDQLAKREAIQRLLREQQAEAQQAETGTLNNETNKLSKSLSYSMDDQQQQGKKWSKEAQVGGRVASN